MCRDQTRPLSNQRGIGLITAIFAVVILGLFGLLISRFVATTTVSSAEEYLWSQAIYAADAGAQLQILSLDNGGGLNGATVNPSVNGFAINITLTCVNGHKSIVESRAARGLNPDIVRTVEVRNTGLAHDSCP